MVDKSTRFFWAASYGQIYPELKRLAERGLIEGSDESQRRAEADRLLDHRRRARGSQRVARLRTSRSMSFATKALLKLFFAGKPHDRTMSSRPLETKREAHAGRLERFREIEPFANAADDFGPPMVLRYGLAYNEFAVRWCERRARRTERSKRTHLMLDRLANLAGGHPKRVLSIAGIFFLVAGALGSGVADRLDPYGADDPDKESFIAKEKLEGAGYRDAQAIVLIQDADPTTPEGGRAG